MTMKCFIIEQYLS